MAPCSGCPGFGDGVCPEISRCDSPSSFGPAMHASSRPLRLNGTPPLAFIPMLKLLRSPVGAWHRCMWRRWRRQSSTSPFLLFPRIPRASHFHTIFHCLDPWSICSRHAMNRVWFIGHCESNATEVVVKHLWVPQTAPPPVFIYSLLEESIRLCDLTVEHVQLSGLHWGLTIVAAVEGEAW